MTERVLSTRELNRALLARQLLLERGRCSLPKALERIGGIQAQYAPSMYIGLWSRLEGFEREQLTRALGRRRVVQGTLLRSTIHLVSPADWWTFAAAIRGPRRESWLRYHRGDPSAATLASAARKVRSRLAEGPLNRAELQQLVGMGAVGTNAMSHWLDLVRVPPSGTWERRRADLFADAETWIGPNPKPDELDARAELARSYLRGFGPARVGEIADWAGLGLRQVTAALKRFELRRFRVRGRRRARRSAAPTAARPRDAGSGPLPPGLGRDPARARPPHPDPSRGLPLAGLQREDATLAADLPRRRGGRRQLAPREGADPAAAVSPPRPGHAPSARRGGGTTGHILWLSDLAASGRRSAP